MFFCLEVYCKNLLLGDGRLVLLKTVTEGSGDHQSMLDGLDLMKLALGAEL